MKTRAVRLYGKNDLHLDEYELRPISEGEILIRVVSDSLCMSTYKTVIQGADHLRVPDNVAEHPSVIGHEFCAEIAEVGERWKECYHVGDKVMIAPVLDYLGTVDTIGYSFEEIGGDCTYAIVYEHIIENGHLIKINSDTFFSGSLVEPVSCSVRAFKSSIHLDENGMPTAGLKKGGKVALLAACGPMGLGAIDYALHGDYHPSMVVVTDLDETRLERAKQIFNPEEAEKNGIKLIFINSSDAKELREISEGTGFDDVFVYAPVPAVVELGDAILAFDGCLNFFAGPVDREFRAGVNFYDVHYAQHHFAGTSGSNMEDMQDVVRLINEKRINPAAMVTHIGGLDAVIDATLNFPKIPGGKKLIYTHIHMPLTAIEDFETVGKEDSRFLTLAQIVKKNGGLWCTEAEQYLLGNFE